MLWGVAIIMRASKVFPGRLLLVSLHISIIILYMYMAWIFITQYFQLTNGAQIFTRFVICTFLIKSTEYLVNVPLKYTEQGR